MSSECEGCVPPVWTPPSSSGLPPSTLAAMLFTMFRMASRGRRAQADEREGAAQAPAAAVPSPLLSLLLRTDPDLTRMFLSFLLSFLQPAQFFHFSFGFLGSDIFMV